MTRDLSFTSLWRRLPPLCVLGLLAFIPVAPQIAEWAYPWSHDFYRNPILFSYFRDAFDAGVWYPRWLPDLFAGYGYPTFVFYPPGVYFGLLPLSFVISDPIALFLTGGWLMFLLGAGGVYASLRAWGGGRLLALFGAGVFMLTPYIYVDYYVRNALAELLAMQIAPWGAYLLLRLKAQQRERGELSLGLRLGVAGFAGGLVCAHPLMACLIMPLWGVLAMTQVPLWRRDGALRRYHLEIILAVSLAAALTAPYWAPVLQLRDAASMAKITQEGLDPVLHMVYPAQLFELAWGFSGSGPGPDDGMSFQLGAAHVVLALIGVVAGWRDWRIRITALLYAGFVLAMLTVAEPLWRMGGLRMLQFPWRLLGITGVLQTLLLAGLANVRLLRDGDRQRNVLLACLGVCVLSGAAWLHSDQFFMRTRQPFLSREHIADLKNDIPHAFITFTVSNEFAPTGAEELRHAPRGDRPFVQGDGVCRARELEGSTPFRLRYEVKCDEPGAVVINQAWFPGWEARVGGQEAEPGRGPHGRIRLDLERGDHLVEAGYDGPPHWSWRNAAVLAMLLVYAGREYWRRRTS